MKSNKYQKRFYRQWTEAQDLHSAHIVARETDLFVLCNKPPDKDFILEKVRLLRWDIENYITRDRKFLTSLKPIAVELNAPRIIKEMHQAARSANVGPMAAVAGAVAESVGKDLLKRGYSTVIVENGGDIFLKTASPRQIGIYAGRSPLWRNLKLKVRPQKTPLGICASSGTIGHSLNFGQADCVVILSRNTALADAVATAASNRVQGKKDLPAALDFACRIKGVLGALIIFKNNLISAGEVEFAK
jgi:ApbE superfamily uncharacterized protein (UPF0280 family)